MPNELVFFLEMFVAFAAVVAAARYGEACLVALMCAMIVLMNIVVFEQMDLFGMELTGGNALFGAVCLASDVLAEHWGRRTAYRAVRIGFFVSAFFVVITQTILLYRPNAADAAYPALKTLFTPTWRIVGASMFSYIVTQHIDVWIFQFVRRATQGRALWLRSNSSTWISQLLDSVIFTTLAFAGTGFPILNMIAFTYIVKVAASVLNTPFLYLTKIPALSPRGAVYQPS
jgi:uncharacterized integral membrane protein (TIGR00697 family)